MSCAIYCKKWTEPHLGRKNPWPQLLLQTPEGQGRSKCLRQADLRAQQHQEEVQLERALCWESEPFAAPASGVPHIFI